MKKYLRLSLYMVAAVIMSVSAASCSDDDDADYSKEEALRKANTQFVDNTVIPTYKTLADKAIELQEAMEAAYADQTDANMAKVCTLWKSSRQYWEWSEAFLFGAAAQYGIDPHIDTWPLDKTALEALLGNNVMMNDIENVVANLNNGLVGFHGIEYIIFREGQNRPVAQIPDKEFRYAIAVAKDLTLSCCRLEAAWAGMDAVTEEKQDIITDAEMEPANNFGELMKLAGQAGSTWKSVTAGSEQILEGCRTIVDEVGNSKIGKPHTGEDIAYIESPHAYNSIQDFEDNIRSVQYAYLGGLGATSTQSESISAYIRSVDSAADQAVIDAIDNCIAKIQAMPKPFVLNYTSPKATQAIKACDVLDRALKAAQQVLLKN